MLLAQHGRRGEEPPAHPEPRAGTALRSPLAVRRGTERRGGSVSGIVKDPNGQPVLGVTVVVPGTTRGTTTDADGRYTIEAATGETLNFSYIGYKQQTLRVNGQTRIDVTLEEDNTSLEEVVVVGYGLQKRRDIVGAVETSRPRRSRSGTARR